MTNTLLRGPVDPDIFRVKVHGARWYRDPLPADDRWPEMTEAVPAVTTVKKAWSKPFRKKTDTGLLVSLDAFRAATYVVNNLSELVDMHPEQALAMVATAPERDLTRASDRGTAVHSIMEAYAAGVEPAVDLLDEDVKPYVDACRAFVNEWRPRWRMTEVVAFNRQIGWGGTCDAVVELPGLGLVIVDWKSRGEKHGAYSEEACQIGGYAAADYFVVTDALGNLRRIDVPELDAGAVVSLCPDGTYAVYPIDVSEAKRSWLSLFETWRVRRDGESVARRAIGHPLVKPIYPSFGDQDSPNEGEHEAEPNRTAKPIRQHDLPGNADNARGNANDDAKDDDGAPGHLGDDPKLDERPGDDQQERGHDGGDDEADRQAILEYLRERVRRIADALNEHKMGLPLPWPHNVPTFKSGGFIDSEGVLAIDEWCWDVEKVLGLPFPSTRPLNERPSIVAASEASADAPESTDAHTPTPNAEPTALEWAERGRALLGLLEDDELARACAEVARVDAVRMSRVHFLALQAVVTQVQAPDGVLIARWEPPGRVSVRPVPDMETALVAALPVGEEIKTTRYRAEALRRARNVAKRLERSAPRSFADVCGDMVLAACVAVGHGITESEATTPQPQGVMKAA